MAWEFITKEVNLPTDKLYVSVHHSDDEALEIWHRDIGVPRDRIVKLGDKDNSDHRGRLQACSEIYIDQGPKLAAKAPIVPRLRLRPLPRILESGFHQYDRAEDGTLTPLNARTSIPAWALNASLRSCRASSTTLKMTCLLALSTRSKILLDKFNESPKIRTALKVVSDHARALSFALADGALPGSEAAVTFCARFCAVLRALATATSARTNPSCTRLFRPWPKS